jgi:hypothetical protein
LKRFLDLIKFLRSSKKIVLLIIIVAALTLLSSALISIWLSTFDDIRVPSVGTMITVGVGAYWDENCENKTEAIDWGVVWPGSSKNVTLYLQSQSNVATRLSVNATNWEPIGIMEYMNLTWDYNNSLVQPLQVIKVTLTLWFSSSSSFTNYLISNNVKEFSFDITVNVSEE